MGTKTIIATTCACLAFIASNVSATVITLDATNSGWYSDYPSSNGDTTNMLAGKSDLMSFRNWIAFDLSGISGTIESATLSIANHANNDTGVTFTWSEVTTSFSELSTVSNNISNNFDVYRDLADGSVFASGIAVAGGVDSYTLTISALTSLNNNSGLWAMGGTTLNDLMEAYGSTGGVSSGDLIQLTLQGSDVKLSNVPAPAAVWLFSSGLLGLISIARRKNS